MKLKLIKTAAALAVVATFLAVCKFTGTTADFKEDNRDGYIAKNNSVTQPGKILSGGLPPTPPPRWGPPSLNVNTARADMSIPS